MCGGLDVALGTRCLLHLRRKEVIEGVQIFQRIRSCELFSLIEWTGARGSFCVSRFPLDRTLQRGCLLD